MEVDECSVVLLNLPDELLLIILHHLDIEGISALAQVCHRLNALATSPLALARVSFGTNWPSLGTKHVFDRATACENFEAAVKLAVAHLYGEGIPASADDSSRLLALSEQLMPEYSAPFTWFLYRPPWSTEVCSKAKIFRDTMDNRQAQCSPNASGRLSYCVAKVYQHKNDTTSLKHYERALELGCGAAAVELVQSNAMSSDEKFKILKKGVDLGSLEAMKHQCQLCLTDKLLKSDSRLTHAIVQKFLHVTTRIKRRQVARQPDLDAAGKMRFILMDWLVEVADLKRFSSDTLSCAIELVDIFLEKDTITRRTLQLLGIACMVIAARMLEPDVITIREASWLTDYTYTYEQIVRIIGHIVFVAGGNLRPLSLYDVVSVYNNIYSTGHQARYSMFLAELTYLHFPSSSFPKPILAAAVYALAAMSMGERNCWPQRLRDTTGITIVQFQDCLGQLYNKIFQGAPVLDHRNVELSNIRERFEKKFGPNTDLYVPQVELDESFVSLCMTRLLEEERCKSFQFVRRSVSAPAPLTTITNTPVMQLRKEEAMDIDDGRDSATPCSFATV